MTEPYEVVKGSLSFIGPESGYLADCVLDDLESAGLVIVKSNEKKLNPHQVRAIRSKHKLGDTQANLADFYGVNPATISRIVRGYYH